MRGDQVLVYLVAVAVSAIATIAHNTEANCRCLDSNAACWPTQDEWAAFNATVGGRLIVPKPTGFPCHDPHADAAQCKLVRENYFDSYFRAENAGSMQNENWEDDGQRTCSMNAPTSSVCYQGQVPALGVQVEAIADVQKAIKFAADHNLRLVVKTSGHDYLGRSTAAGAFLIWMHKLNSITIHESFLPSGSGHQDAVRAITVVGGATWGEVYDALKPTGYIVVGGLCLSIAATGGYVQGGGHGTLGPSFGLATDNVLEIEVVTADGKLRVANAWKEPDLFFALRGGGGGSFGVVTSVTYKLNRTPSELVGIFMQLRSPNGTPWKKETLEEILTAWSSGTAALDKERWGGYWTFDPVQFIGYFLVPSTQEAANATLKPILQALSQIDDATPDVTYYNVSTFQDWHATVNGILYPKTLTQYVGDRWLLGSRIIPFSALKDPRRVVKNILAAWEASGKKVVYAAMVIGPGVRSADPEKQTSVTPAWREGIWFMPAVSTWSWNATKAEKATARNQMKAFVVSLQKSYPDSGTYMNEASIDEPQWQRSFWGLSNYARLLATKMRVDPLGLFVCRRCVGSELWDENGNCRRRAD